MTFCTARARNDWRRWRTVDNTSITSLIPSWTREDYQGSTPFEWLYQYRNDKFTMIQLRDEIKARAGAVGVRNFIALWNAFLELKARDDKLELTNTTEFDGQQIELYCGSYICNDDGIAYTDRLGAPVIVCRHPVLPISRLVNIDTGEMKLEIAFKRGSKWRTVIVDRSLLASQQRILELSALGVAVDSDNAKELVKYITYVESQNYEKLGETNSVGRLGWVEQGFSPYVDDLRFDGDLSFSHMFEAVQPKGDMTAWLNCMTEARKNSLIVRIMLAASFSSVLVDPLGCLPFFVHVWGGTEAGKTVGLMAAASVWANPSMGEYIHTFNNTAVGQEMMAGFCNNLPLCFDELQIIKDRQDFDKTIYMLTEGIGKGRGAKTGGLQKTYTWRNCIITTGEMPITNTNSGGGAVNRIVEVDCKDEKLFSDPRGVINIIRQNYGMPGKLFVGILQSKMDEAKKLYQEIYADLIQGESTEKQAMAAAVILTADRLSAQWIFGDKLNISLSEIGQYLTSKEDVDANMRALDWIYEFVASNSVRFRSSDDNPGEVWGEVSNSYIYIIKSIFDSKMKDAGFNPVSFLSWAKRRDLLETSSGSGFRKRKRLKGIDVLPWCVCIKQDIASETVQNDELPF